MFNPPNDRIAGRKVNFMATCLCDSIFSDAAKNAVQILKHFGAEVSLPHDQTCCGQPAFNSGDFASARKVLLSTMRAFGGNSDPIVVPSASCAAMLYHSSKIAFRESAPDVREKVDAFARRVWEFCDFLVNVLGVEKIPGKYEAKVALHNSCHGVRMMGLSSPSELHVPYHSKLRDLLAMVDDIEVAEPERRDECCGFGGMFSVEENAVSVAMGRAKVARHTATGAEYITGADSSCLMHMQGIIDREKLPIKTIHIVQILNSHA